MVHWTASSAERPHEAASDSAGGWMALYQHRQDVLLQVVGPQMVEPCMSKHLDQVCICHSYEGPML